MIGRLVLAIVLGLGPGLAAAEPASSLKRLTLRQDVLGWEGVGRLDLEDGFCTGALIAPDLVLTAAHCVLGVDARQDPARLRFRAGLRDGEAVAERGVRRIVAHRGYVPGAIMNAANVRHDVALLELDAPIPSGVARSYRVDRPARTGAEVGLVSVAAGREAALSRQPACRVVGDDGDIMAFDCDADFGASGAPVFDRALDPPRIVSIISGGAETDQGIVAFGMALPKVVADLKNALRTGDGVWPKAEAVAPALGLAPGHRGAGHFQRP